MKYSEPTEEGRRKERETKSDPVNYESDRFNNTVGFESRTNLPNVLKLKIITSPIMSDYRSRTREGRKKGLTEKLIN